MTIPRDVCRAYWDRSNCGGGCDLPHIPRPPANERVCTLFWAFGRCSKGSLCRNTHRQYDGAGTQKAKQEKRTNRQPKQRIQVPSFFHLMKSGRPLRQQHQMRRFILSALCERDVHDVVLQLGGSDKGLAYLRALLQAEFTVNAGNARERVSFHRVAVPLCHFLALDGVSNSPHASATNQIYATVFQERLFFPQLLLCLERVIAQDGSLVLDPVPEEPCSWNPADGATDVLLPVCRLYVLLLSRTTDAPADQRFGALLPRLQALGERYPTCQPLIQVLALSGRILARSRNRDAAFARAHQVARAPLDCRETGPGELLLAEEEPGERRPEGARHDNDFADFRRISILPTDQEIRCEVQPYIPRRGGSEHVADPLDRLLDVQFRQLREDMLCSVRRGVQHFLRSDCLRTMPADAYRWTSPGGSLADGSVRLMIYRRVSFAGVRASLFRGTEVVVEFAQLPEVRRMKTKKRREQYWDGLGARQLQRGSLVCLAVPVGRDGAAQGGQQQRPRQMVFGVVNSREPPDLNDANRVQIGIELLLTTSIEHLFEFRESLGEAVLLQVRGHFFMGYQPILRALQDHSAESIPFTRVIVAPDPNALGIQAPPEYLEDSPAWDLSCIARKGRGGSVSVVPVTDYEQLARDLHKVEDDLVLDDTQIDAFALALTRRVSLIQGPPGTGKTYVGVHVVRALLANSSGPRRSAWTSSRQAVLRLAPLDKRPGLNPILCICYTNHALDQFLEDLVKEGVPLGSVVRIGSRSRSEVLQERSLNRLRRQGAKETPAEYRQRKDILEDVAFEEEEIKRLSKLCVAEKISNKEMLSWVQDYQEEFYEALTQEDEEGFIRGKTDKAILETWLGKGKPTAEDFRVARDAGVLLRNVEEDDIWEWTNAERRGAWELFKIRCRQISFEDMKTSLNRMQKLVKKKRQLDDALSLRILKTASIVGVTTSSAAIQQSLLQSLGARVIVCEEAGEVLESHILAALTPATKQLVLIGDHLQLRPKVSEYVLSVASGSRFDLNLSLFERLVRKYSKSRLPSLCTLLTQRRMRPQIADLLRATLYPSLRDGPNVLEHPALLGFQHNLWFFDHSWREQSNENQSYTNPQEAAMVLKLVQYAIRHGYVGDRIAVITPYVGQLMLLRKLFSSARMMLFIGDADLEALDAVGGLDRDVGDEAQQGDVGDEAQQGDAGKENKQSAAVHGLNLSVKQSVRLATVDNFQGEEADVMIISTVRCNPRGQTGFLKEDSRVNVMLSRARHGMLVLGSRATVMAQGRRGPQMFGSVLARMEEQDLVAPFVPLRCQAHGNLTKAREPLDVSVDGGCHEVCKMRKNCGHPCARKCHPDDIDHRDTNCLEPCTRLLPDCGHRCPRLCGEPCGGCPVVVERQLPCGHMRKSRCSDATWSRARCEAPVAGVGLICGHTAVMACHRARKMEEELQQHHPTFSCKQVCGGRLECKHHCAAKCGECAWLTHADKSGTTVHKPCEQPCGRSLFCGHQCAGTPCHTADKCPPCQEPCPIQCEHSECSRRCHAPCPPCARPCTWECTCEQHGRKCPLPCCSPCDRLPCDARCARSLTCGHRCPSVCGERCPPQEFCQQCGSKAAEVIDLIELKTLADADLNTSPIIVLSDCDHVFTVETLDGAVGMNAVYSRDGGEGPWTALKPLDVLVPRPACPTCRAPIANVRRYGRVVNLASLQIAQRKFLAKCKMDAAKLTADAERIDEGYIQGQEFVLPGKRESLVVPAKVSQKLEKMVRRARGLVQSFWKECPYTKAYEMQCHKQMDVDPVPFEPSVQPLIALQLALSRCLRVKISLHCLRFEVEEALQCYQEGCKVLEEALQQCSKTNALRSLLSARILYCFLYLNMLQNLQGVIEEDVSVAKDLRERQRDVLGDFDELVQRTIAEGEGAAPDGQIEFFRQEVKEWKRVSGEPFYSKVTHKEKLAIYKVMGADVGTNNEGGYGGHWYQCPNGHVYTIGECGGAMQQSVCPECGEVVGGDRHRLHSTNRKANGFLREVRAGKPGH